MRCVENTVHFPKAPFLNNHSKPHLIMGASQAVSAVKNIQFIHSRFQPTTLAVFLVHGFQKDILADVNEAIIKGAVSSPKVETLVCLPFVQASYSLGNIASDCWKLPPLQPP